MLSQIERGSKKKQGIKVQFVVFVGKMMESLLILIDGLPFLFCLWHCSGARKKKTHSRQR